MRNHFFKDSLDFGIGFAVLEKLLGCNMDKFLVFLVNSFKSICDIITPV